MGCIMLLANGQQQQAMTDPLVIIDADSILFKAALTQDKDKYQMRRYYKKLIDEIKRNTFSDEAIVGVKGTGIGFRYEIYPDYKKNRPPLEQEMKDALNYIYQYALDLGAIPAREGWEADDECAEWVREATAEGWDFVLAHIDKDLDMIPGKHYNYNKVTHYEVDNDSALRHFYFQLLVGDSADHIPGVNGIGPVKANRLLDDHSTNGFYDAVLSKWDSKSDMERSARCLFMGDPALFTWDLRKLYATEEETKEDPCVEAVCDVDSDGEQVLHRDDE